MRILWNTEVSRRYPAKTITDADYADDVAILANTPDQAETLLHSSERAAAGIGLYVNAHKTEYMCYNQTGEGQGYLCYQHDMMMMMVMMEYGNLKNGIRINQNQ